MSPAALDALVRRLEPHARRAAEGADPAHDYGHVARVVENARVIARGEGVDPAVPIVAALLHELFSYPKGHPDSPRSGYACAERAAVVLRDEGAPEELARPVCRAIEEHPFSLGVTPETIEGRVLQDADRVDALGAIGLARMWATCSTMGRPLYADEDPFCEARAPDDKLWGLDHVYKKLLLLPERLHTASGRALAADRARFMREYLAQLARELPRATMSA